MRHISSVFLPSAAGLSLNKTGTFWLKLSDALPSDMYAGIPERFEIEITGKLADEFQRDIYYIQTRGGLQVYRKSENGGLPLVNLRVYNDTTVPDANSAADKYYVVLHCTHIGWYSLSVQARDLGGGSWMPIEYHTNDPVAGLTEEIFTPEWVDSEWGDIDVNGDLTVTGKIISNGSGNTGIGTDDPKAKLHVQVASVNANQEPHLDADNLVIEDTRAGLTILSSSGPSGLGSIQFSDKTANKKGEIAFIHGNNTDSMTFSTNGVEAIRIDNTGNVGIGTSTPAGELHVQSTNSRILTVENHANGDGFGSGDIVRIRNSSLKTNNKYIKFTANWDADESRACLQITL